jgi:hypothetical protein
MREVIGYSICFKDKNEAKKFFKKVPKVFDARLNLEEKEVVLVGTEPVRKEDFAYLFLKEGDKVSLEPLKIEFLTTLFARD